MKVRTGCEMTESVKQYKLWAAPVGGAVKGFKLMIWARPSPDYNHIPFYTIFKRRAGDTTNYDVTTVCSADVLYDGIAPSINSMLKMGEVHPRMGASSDPNFVAGFPGSHTVYFKGLRKVNVGDEIVITKKDDATQVVISCFVQFYYGQ